MHTGIIVYMYFRNHNSLQDPRAITASQDAPSLVDIARNYLRKLRQGTPESPARPGKLQRDALDVRSAERREALTRAAGVVGRAEWAAMAVVRPERKLTEEAAPPAPLPQNTTPAFVGSTAVYSIEANDGSLVIEGPDAYGVVNDAAALGVQSRPDEFTFRPASLAHLLKAGVSAGTYRQPE